MKRLVFRSALSVAIVSLGGLRWIVFGGVASAAVAATPVTNCVNFSPATGTTIHGDLTVKGDHAFCDLVDVHVTGRVTVFPGGSLVTDDVTRIGGMLTLGANMG